MLKSIFLLTEGFTRKCFKCSSKNQNIHASVTKQPETFSALLCIPITLPCYTAANYISCSTIKLTFTCAIVLLPSLSADNHKTNYIQTLHGCAFFSFLLSATLLRLLLNYCFLHCCVFCSAVLCHFFTLETLFFTLLHALLCSHIHTVV